MKTIAAALILAAASWPLRAEVPLQIGFQGTFSSTGALPTLEFRVVDSPLSDAPLGGWSESTAPFTADGTVNILLGAQSPIPRAVFADRETTRFLWLKTGAGAPVRQKLVSVPYAYQASLAGELAGGTTVQGGLAVSGDAGALRLTAANDHLILDEPGGPPDEKRWILKANGGDLGLLTANDAFTGFAQALRVSRTGAGVDSVLFPNGNVGIGAAPVEKLTVAGAVHSMTGGFKFPDGSVQTTAAGGGGVSPAADIHWMGVHTWQSSATFVNRNLSIGSNDFVFKDGKLGMGVANPLTNLHIDGNIFMETAPIIEINMRRNDLTDRPMFKMGRIIHAGDGDPEFRFLYVDDATVERTVLEFDKKGIVASVKPSIGSHFEGFIGGDSEPLFRLNSFPQMQLELGAGGAALPDVAFRRVGQNALAFFNRAGDPGASTIQTETLRIDAAGNVGVGTDHPEARLQVAGGDVAVTTVGRGVILRATDGSNCFRLTVNNAGNLSAAPVACP